MKNSTLSMICVVASLALFSTANCINNFSIAYNLEQDRHIAAVNACSLLPGGGDGCMNHAAEQYDVNMQSIESNYNCCEFDDC